MAKRESTLYLSGLMTGAMVVWVARLAARRWLYPRPASVVSSVLPMLRAHREVRRCVGAQLVPGLLQAYSLEGGLKWRGLHYRTSPFYWKSPSLAVLFQVHGEVSSAFVGLSVGRDKAIRTLVVDLPSGERLLLKGTAEHSLLQRYHLTTDN